MLGDGAGLMCPMSCLAQNVRVGRPDHLSSRGSPGSPRDAIAKPVDHGNVAHQVHDACHASCHQGSEGIKGSQEVGLSHEDD